MKIILKYIVIFIILISIFVATLCLSCLIPSSLLKENVQESSEILLSESNRKKVYIPIKQLTFQFDNFTDALMINTAYSIDSKTPLYSAFTAKKNYIPGTTKTIMQDSVSELKSASKYNGYHNEVGELYDVAHDDIEESFEYARYWHGYLIFLRPLLLLFNVNTIRIILTIIFILLGIWLLYLIYKKLSPILAIIFFIGLVGVEYLYMGISLQGASIFLILMIASIYILIRNEKIKNIGIIFFVIGMLTNFFDFLTVPILTYGVPLIIYFLLQQKNRDLTFKETIIIFLKTGISWILGYAGTWIAKWILMDLIYDRNLLETAIRSSYIPFCRNRQKIFICYYFRAKYCLCFTPISN